MKKIIILILFIISCFCTVNINAFELINLKKIDGVTDIKNRSGELVTIPNIYEKQKNDFRGVWISPLTGCVPQYENPEQYKKAIDKILDVCEYYNINAIVFHIRTHNNALYKSKLNPVSVEAVDYGWDSVNFDEFDPLEYTITQTHNRGMEFHAWMNPYRLTTAAVTDLEEYAKLWPSYNIASKPEYLMTGSTGVILNPGEPAVRDFITETCIEVIENYDVDAIHFDDYFYISGNMDQHTYDKYKEEDISIADWRRMQVDILIEKLHNEIRTYNIENNRLVQIGISPSGIYKNGNGIVTYDDSGKVISTGSNTSGFAHYGDYLYSDTLKWAEEGWIDYLIPQSYWAFEHSTADYDDVMGWWDKAAKNMRCNVYSGIGFYMAFDYPTSSASWGTNPYEVTNQIKYLTKLENIYGACIFKYLYLEYCYLKTTSIGASNGMAVIKNEMWNSPALLPEIRTYQPITLAAPKGLAYTLSNNTVTLTWDKVANASRYVIYRAVDELSYSADEIIAIVSNTDITGKVSFSDNLKYSDEYKYAVKAISKTNTEGQPAFKDVIYSNGIEFTNIGSFGSVIVNGNLLANATCTVTFDTLSDLYGTYPKYTLEYLDGTEWMELEFSRLIRSGATQYIGTFKMPANRVFQFMITAKNSMGLSKSEVQVLTLDGFDNIASIQIIAIIDKQKEAIEKALGGKK